MIARIGAVVNRNLLLVGYWFGRLAKSFKRGELQRRWGEKVTIGKTRGETSFWANGVRGVTQLFELAPKPAHAKTYVCGTQILSTSLSATRPSELRLLQFPVEISRVVHRGQARSAPASIARARKSNRIRRAPEFAILVSTCFWEPMTAANKNVTRNIASPYVTAVRNTIHFA